MAKTPDEKWKSTVLDYRRKCQKILGVSNSVRYVGVINEYGRTLAGMVKPNVRPLLTQDYVRNEFFIVTNMIMMRNSQAKALGPLDSVVLKHQKVTVVCIPSAKAVFYVSLNPKAKDLNKIIDKIKGIV